MLTLRKASERGAANHGWLKSFHTFSFANYYDPEHMGFSALRVINDDTVEPGMGFGTHGHRDMEIISYVLDGDIAHKDSQGNIKTLPAGEFQLMSAGSGITHSEYNHNIDKGLNFLQIWIEPNIKGQIPGYQQKDFGQLEGLTHVISPNGVDGSLQIKQNAHLYQLILKETKQAELKRTSARQYVHLISGQLAVNGIEMQVGDGLKISNEETLFFLSLSDVPIKALVFELP
jgi:redox-sensitive bicupin YhaK (pirin superfamily)